MSHLMISAAHKSSGKTTIAAGLCAAFRRRGTIVQPFKKGPDYIDPLWLSKASGRECCNLDFYTQSRQEIESALATRLQDADFGLIEGNKGLYDGLDLDGSNSNAALAVMLDTPVVLVLDTRGMTRGIAPLILGYQGFEPDIRIAGVILNHVGGPRHEAKLRRVIEHYTDVQVIGAVAHQDELAIEERHLGLIPSAEVPRSAELIERLGDDITAQVDLDRLQTIAGTAGPATGEVLTCSGSAASDVRIGYAHDRAFGFYYASDLAALRRAGAELVPFDTLSDQRLPNVDGLFIGGGFPETSMAALESNRSLRADIAAFIGAGGPAYAECGGLMYLCRSIIWQGRRAEMVGAIPADALMHDRPQGRGYVRLAETPSHPWGGLPSNGGVVMAHEFHYAALEHLAAELPMAYRVERGHGIDGQSDGIVHKRLLASFSHLRDTDLNHWAARFVAFVRDTMGERGYVQADAGRG